MNLRNLQEKIAIEELLFKLILQNDMENFQLLLGLEPKPIFNLNAINVGAVIPSFYGNSTPLMVAAFYNRPMAVKLLLEAKADVNLRNTNGHNARDLATSSTEIRDMLTLFMPKPVVVPTTSPVVVTITSSVKKPKSSFFSNLFKNPPKAVEDKSYAPLPSSPKDDHLDRESKERQEKEHACRRARTRCA